MATEPGKNLQPRREHGEFRSVKRGTVCQRHVHGRTKAPMSPIFLSASVRVGTFEFPCATGGRARPNTCQVSRCPPLNLRLEAKTMSSIDPSPVRAAIKSSSRGTRFRRIEGYGRQSSHPSRRFQSDRIARMLRIKSCPIKRRPPTVRYRIRGETWPGRANPLERPWSGWMQASPQAARSVEPEMHARSPGPCS